MTHQTYSHVGRTYVSPFKRAVVDDEGTLRFSWWEANEGLKGGELTPPEPSGRALSKANRSVGVILEATVKLPPADAADTSQRPGFVIETTGGGAIVAAVSSTGLITLATVANASAPTNATIVEWGTFDRNLDLMPGTTVSLRLLLRRDMLELYLDDLLFPVYLIGSVPALPAPATTGRVGLLPTAAGLVSAARLWNMSLPGDGEHAHAASGSVSWVK